MPRPLLTSSQSLCKSDLVFHRVHAAVGLYVLCHFLLRYVLFFAGSDDMGFGGTSPRLLLLILSPHLALQLSGLAFDIPRKRHPDGNRIWPQYRYEALVFCGRCLALLLFASWNKERMVRRNDDAPTRSGLALARSAPFIPAAIVIAAMMAADSVTNRYRTLRGGGSSRTIRDLSGPPGALYLMSSAQFHATLHSIMTTDRMGVQIAALTVVQTSAFGMTLRRKGIITQRQGLCLYSLVLALGMIVIARDLADRGVLCRALFYGNAAAMMRMDCGMNKYILWTLMTGVVHEAIREKDSEPDLNASSIWPSLTLISTFLLLYSARKRQRKES
mmetsp:Transcript_40250/g.121254  ORF Transcript_40250/g.121254 Transcript_40250/m.121254 type:complete len:331 (-) Transcript_40250:322-1314(-)